MNSLEKITTKSTVSSWITLVNRIVDFLKLAKAPAGSDKGCIGLMTPEDKEKLDNLSDTYLPIKGVHPVDATWKVSREIRSSDAMYLRVIDENAIVYTGNSDLNIEVVAGTPQEFAIKHFCLPSSDIGYIVTITNKETELKRYEVSSKLIVVKIIFAAGEVIISEE